MSPATAGEGRCRSTGVSGGELVEPTADEPRAISNGVRRHQHIKQTDPLRAERLHRSQLRCSGFNRSVKTRVVNDVDPCNTQTHVVATVQRRSRRMLRCQRYGCLRTQVTRAAASPYRKPTSGDVQIRTKNGVHRCASLRPLKRRDS